MLGTKNDDQAKDISITADGIKNFLSAVCEIVVYDLEYSKNFVSIELVLKKLEKDQIFSQAIKNKMNVLSNAMTSDIEKIEKNGSNNQSIIYKMYFKNLKEYREKAICQCYEFCLFVSFFLPQTQRDQFQNEALKKYYERKNFYLKVPLSLQKYLSNDLQEIIYSKCDQQNDTQSNNDLNHYETNKIRDDDDEFNNDKKLQRRYIKLLKVIRDDIVFGSNADNKNKLLIINNALIKTMNNIQKMYKQMPGWLRSKFKIDWLDDLTIREKHVMKKNNNQILFYQLNENNSGNKIRSNTQAIIEIIGKRKLSDLNSSVEISTAKIRFMNFLSFFYYGLNLKFFADLFRLDMHEEDFTILIPLLLVMAQMAGFVWSPFYLPFVHLFSVIFGLVFLIFNLSIYEGKFISSEDINSYNAELNNFSSFIKREFDMDNIDPKIKSLEESSEYDKIIDEYEGTNNLHISSGCHENGSCDCNCDCDCPSAEECLCGCFNACAQDPHCCECVGLCCLMLVCPLCIPCIAGGRQL